MNISNKYREMGIHGFYEIHHLEYENPHAGFVRECMNVLWNSNWKTILDLACGDGLVTKWILENHKNTSITGCDKFFKKRYETETLKECFPFSFEDIANNKTSFNQNFDCIVISYAIDLVPLTYLNKLLWTLSLITKNLLVIRPNNHLIDHAAFKLISKTKCEKSKGSVYKTIL